MSPPISPPAISAYLRISFEGLPIAPETARGASDEPPTRLRRAPAAPYASDAIRHERRRVPDSSARAGRSGAHHVGLSRDRRQRRRDEAPAWSRPEPLQ